MCPGPNEDADLTLVEELLFVPRGLALERFSHAETVAGRTPDFRVRRGSDLVAYCEVKSPRDDWLLEQLQEAPPGAIAGGVRDDPVFNRIARHVLKASTQFDAVNPAKEAINVLVFVNHDDASNYGDLHETVTGVFLADDGSRHPTMMRIAEGRLGEARQRIDLYVWIDVETRRIQGYLFNDANAERVRTACDLFGLASSRIRY